MGKSYFFMAIALITLNACENDIGVINSINFNNPNQLPIESSKNVEILFSDSAIVRAKLNTPQLEYFSTTTPYHEMAKGMNVIFYTEDKVEQTKLTANYGIGYDTGNGIEKMEAKGNVIVINEKGDKLNTEHLIWNTKTEKIYTDEFVKITTKDEIIWGDGMEADQSFSEYEIKNVKGQLKIKE